MFFLLVNCKTATPMRSSECIGEGAWAACILSVECDIETWAAIRPHEGSDQILRLFCHVMS